MANIQFTGTLGQDVKTIFTQEGKPIASFSVAESIYVGKGQAPDGKDYATEWYSVTVFGPQAGTIGQKVQKGSRVTVFGETQTRSYFDKKENVWKEAKGPKVVIRGGGSTVVAHERNSGGAATAPAAEAEEDLSDLLN